MLNITLAVGEASPAVLRALAAALNFLAEQLTGLPAQPNEQPDWIKNALPPEPSAAALPSEQPPADIALPAAEPTKRTRKAKAEPAAEPAAEPLSEDGKPAEEVTVEQIRAVARTLNTDALVEQAKAILAKHGVKSVTELGEQANIVRVSALRDFEAVAATIEAA